MILCNARAYCVSAWIIAVLALPLSQISAIGVMLALFALVFAAIAGALSKTYCALLIGILSSVDIFWLSPVTAANLGENIQLLLVLILSYGLLVAGIVVGVLNELKRANNSAD